MLPDTPHEDRAGRKCWPVVFSSINMSWDEHITIFLQCKHSRLEALPSLSLFLPPPPLSLCLSLLNTHTSVYRHQRMLSSQNFHDERQQLVNRIWNLPIYFFSLFFFMSDLTFPLLFAFSALKLTPCLLYECFCHVCGLSEFCLVDFSSLWHSFQTAVKAVPSLGQIVCFTQGVLVWETFHFCAVTPCRLADNPCPAHLLYGLWLSHSHVLGERCSLGGVHTEPPPSPPALLPCWC